MDFAEKEIKDIQPSERDSRLMFSVPFLGKEYII